MDDFEKEIKTEFLNEASTLLEDAEQAFLQLEGTGHSDVIAKIFRLAHNLKGSSKAVGFDHVGEFTHHWESLLLKVKDGVLPMNKSLFNLLLSCLDHVRFMIVSLREDMNATFDSQKLLEQMEKAGQGQDVVVPAPRGEQPVQSPPSVDLTIAEQSADLNLQGDEPDVLNFSPAAFARAIGNPSRLGGKDSGALKKEAAGDESIRVSITKLEKLIDYVGEMVILQSVLREQSDVADSNLVRKTISHLGKVGKEIQDISMSLRMLPIKPTFQKMQRIVRDTAVALNKKVQLVLEGEDAEVDKTVLERLGDPLVHLIRNSVDHGIESAEVREKSGKPAMGTVRLTARQNAGKMVIEVIDDGGGIPVERILKKAEEKGMVKPGTSLTESEIFQLLFLPGFSTKETVTDVSGRGVGMDVVKTNIEAIGGEIQVESKLGQGTTFRIILPLTLAILECTVVRCGRDRYVIPSYHITESLRAEASILRQTILGEVLLIRGENLPVLRLRDLLRSKGDLSSVDPIALVVRSGVQPFVLFVDDILGQYQIVTKPLSPELRNLRGVAGSTILGDGRPALILEVNQFAVVAGKNQNSLKENNRGVA